MKGFQVVRTEVYSGDSTKSDDFESRMQYTYTVDNQVSTLSYQEKDEEIVTGVGEGIKGLKVVVKIANKTADVADAVNDGKKVVKAADKVSDAAKAAKKSGSKAATDVDIPNTKPSINQGKDPFRNADFKKPDIKMVDDAANQVGIDRKEFGNYIHEIKDDLGMKANQNFTYQELLEYAEEYKKMTE